MVGLLARLMQFLGLGEEEEDEEDGQVYEEPSVAPEPDYEVASRRRAAPVVNLHTQKQVRVVLGEPAAYEEAQSIADHLKLHRAVIVNLHKCPFDQALRIVDFLSGCVYAVGGNMQKLGHLIFLCAPENVDVQGTISEYLATEARAHMR